MPQMTEAQMIALRGALRPYKDRVKLEIETTGAAHMLTPYVIAAPETRGPAVEVQAGTSPGSAAKALGDSIRALVEA